MDQKTFDDLLARILSGSSFHKNSEVISNYLNSVPNNFTDIEILKNRKKQALEYLTKAAENNLYATLMVGQFYFFGWEVNKNKKIAVRYYQSAADQNNPAAQAILASCYYYADGVQQNEEAFLKYASLAAEKGDYKGQYWLGYIYFHGLDKIISQNRLEAKKVFESASKQGHGKSSFMIGKIYEYGYSVNQSNLLAIEWYKKAMTQGYPNAQEQINCLKVFNLGNAYTISPTDTYNVRNNGLTFHVDTGESYGNQYIRRVESYDINIKYTGKEFTQLNGKVVLNRRMKNVILDNNFGKNGIFCTKRNKIVHGSLSTTTALGIVILIASLTKDCKNGACLDNKGYYINDACIKEYHDCESAASNAAAAGGIMIPVSLILLLIALYISHTQYSKAKNITRASMIRKFFEEESIDLFKEADRKFSDFLKLNGLEEDPEPLLIQQQVGNNPSRVVMEVSESAMALFSKQSPHSRASEVKIPMSEKKQPSVEMNARQYSAR